MAKKPFPFSVCEECCVGGEGGTVDLTEIENNIEKLQSDVAEIKEDIGNIDSALDELHNYAQSIISGGEE